jgi:hypothetical protein
VVSKSPNFSETKSVCLGSPTRGLCKNKCLGQTFEGIKVVGLSEMATV